MTKVIKGLRIAPEFCNTNNKPMAHHTIETQWMGKMQFNASVNGHTIVMDAPVRVGGEDKGAIPKPFILSALSGCTGMDVSYLLRKKGIVMDDFSMKIIGELSKQQPLEYVSIHVAYCIKGRIDDREAVLSAVNESQEKICGVSSMLKRVMPVTWDVYFNDDMIFSNNPLSELVARKER